MVRPITETAILYLSLALLVVAVTLALSQRYVASVMSLVAGLSLLNYVRWRYCGGEGSPK